MNTLPSSPPSSLAPAPDIEPLDRWLKRSGMSSATGWRMRRRGWLKTVTIAGRPYITAEAIAEFIDRAKAGDFEKIQHEKDSE